MGPASNLQLLNQSLSLVFFLLTELMKCDPVSENIHDEPDNLKQLQRQGDSQSTDQGRERLRERETEKKRENKPIVVYRGRNVSSVMD